MPFAATPTTTINALINRQKRQPKAFSMKNKKNYYQAPLPFMGQKRKWNRDFKRILKTEFADCDIFVDLFGGSGLLSHFAKTERPDTTVIYNIKSQTRSSKPRA